MASLALAIVAIWLSFKFYDMSVRSSEKIEEANRAISASVDRLEKVFQMQYSDTFSMVRDTYSDFRKRLLADSSIAGQSEQIAENKADEKIEQLRNEVRSELTKVVDKLGQTDARLRTVREQIEEVVDKAITRSREVVKEAKEETAKDRVKTYLLGNPKSSWTLVSLMGELGNEFRASEVAIALIELAKEKTIRFDGKNPEHLGDFNITQKFTVAA